MTAAICAIALSLPCASVADPCFPRTLNLNHGPTKEAHEFRYSGPDESYLAELRSEYKLDELLGGCETDLMRVSKVCHWVSERWDHSGDNEPKRDDPLSILREAERGARFRCVEYAKVTAGCLAALGIPARTVGLKTADVETRQSGAGHVVAEAYLLDRKRWVFVDAQEDVVATQDGQPLNAVELQAALAAGSPKLCLCQRDQDSPQYARWVSQYLFYFDVKLDNRVGIIDCSPGKLMLVPIGAKKPTVFQRKHSLGEFKYTHSVRAFYAAPPAVRSAPTETTQPGR